MKDEKNSWTVGVCNTDGNGVDIFHVVGTKAQVKKYLLNCVKTDKESDSESWDYGPKTVKEIEEVGSDGLYACGVYSDYHIDYTATIDTPPILL